MQVTVGPRPVEPKGLTAYDVSNVPAGTIGSMNVQAALNELDTDKLAKAGGAMTGVLVYNTGTVAAGATIVIPDGKQAVVITDDSASAANSLTMPTGVNGQVLFILNLDPAGTTGAFNIPAGNLAQFLYLGDAWRFVSYGVTG